MTFKKVILIIALCMLQLNDCFGQRQFVDSTFEANTYKLINLVFNKDFRMRHLNLLSTPIELPNVNDTIFYPLVRKAIIKQTEIEFFLAQVKKTQIKEWEEGKLESIRIKKSRRKGKLRKNIYGVSIPVYSPNNKLAILYVKYLGPDSTYESIDVYEYENGNWKYTQSLLTTVGY